MSRVLYNDPQWEFSDMLMQVMILQLKKDSFWFIFVVIKIPDSSPYMLKDVNIGRFCQAINNKI